MGKGYENLKKQRCLQLVQECAHSGKSKRLVVQSFQAWFAVSFRMVCRNFILPEICKPCLFFVFLFAKNIIPDRSVIKESMKIR